METFPSQFNNIRFGHNAQKEKWTIEEMTSILTKEEEHMKKGQIHEYFLCDSQGDGGQKRKYPYTAASNEKKLVKKQHAGAKGNGKNVSSTSNAPKNEGFKGKCNYCHKFGHKKTDCRKLNVVQEKNGHDKQKEFN